MAQKAYGYCARRELHTRRPSWLLLWAHTISVAAIVAPPLLTGTITAAMAVPVLSSAWAERLSGAPAAPNDGTQDEPEGQSPA